MGRISSVVNFVFLTAPLVLGLTLAVMIGLARTAPGTTGLGALGGAVLGFALIFGAKLQKFRRGDYFSFGTRSRAPLQRALYVIGYALIALAGVAAVALLAVTHGALP